jgi:hypothetical protein
MRLAVADWRHRLFKRNAISPPCGRPSLDPYLHYHDGMTTHEIPFHATGYGRAFYGGHVPRLVTAMERLAAAAEQIVAALELLGTETLTADDPAPIRDPERGAP